MSEELIRELRARVTELQADTARLKDETIKRRSLIKELRAERDTLRADYQDLSAKADAYLAEHDTKFADLERERDEYKGKAEAPPDDRIKELEGKLRQREHRDAWGEALSGQLADKAGVETVWREIAYTPGEAVPTPEQIKELVGKARDAAPYLFRGAGGSGAAPGGAQQAARRPALVVGDAASRGVRDGTPGRVRYTAEDTRQPGWMTKNPGLRQAIAEGRADLAE